MPLPEVKYARTDTLEIAYEDSGPTDAETIFLLHGFPYDPRAYDAMVPRLVEAGYRTIVPYLRGYGPTRFLKAETPRSGQQAALVHDLLALMDALKIERATHVGYDWGGRAACILAALFPQRVRCLCRRASTTSMIFLDRSFPQRRSKSIDSGINTTFTPSAGARGSRKTGASSAGCCGGCGRRIGSLMQQRSSAAPNHSIIPISWMS